MGNWYVVTKTIKGRRYLYRQRTWREGQRVRTESQYVGPVDPATAAAPRPLPERYAVAAWKRSKLTRLDPLALPSKFRETIRAYTQDLAAAINPALRGDADLTPALKQAALRISVAIRHPDAVLLQDVSLYRAGLLRSDLLTPGKTFLDAGFTSFSVRPKVSDLFAANVQPKKLHTKVVFQLVAKKGDAGFVQLRGVTIAHDEFEVIGRPAHYRIIEVKYNNPVPLLQIERISIFA